MCDSLDRLPPGQRRGSKPRCHLLTHGTPEEVSARLTSLARPYGVVKPTDKWMPMGFEDIEEAELDRATRLIPSGDLRAALQNWWLHFPGGMTPNWDIASTCTIDGSPGLLLIEAKSHDTELMREACGKRFDPQTASFNSRRNHARIGWCIEDASLALSEATGHAWNLSRESHYQMANRFAWSCKLTESGYSVILVYLGFLNTTEMSDRGTPLTEECWPSLVKAHGHPRVPREIWDQKWSLHGRSFIALVRTVEQPLPTASADPPDDPASTVEADV